MKPPATRRGCSQRWPPRFDSVFETPSITPCDHPTYGTSKSPATSLVTLATRPLPAGYLFGSESAPRMFVRMSARSLPLASATGLLTPLGGTSDGPPAQSSTRLGMLPSAPPSMPLPTHAPAPTGMLAPTHSGQCLGTCPYTPLRLLLLRRSAWPAASGLPHMLSHGFPHHLPHGVACLRQRKRRRRLKKSSAACSATTSLHPLIRAWAHPSVAVSTLARIVLPSAPFPGRCEWRPVPDAGSRGPC